MKPDTGTSAFGPPRKRRAPAAPTYVEQTKRAYVTGRIDLDELERDLDAALVMDGEAPTPYEGIEFPRYWTSADGRYLSHPVTLGIVSPSEWAARAMRSGDGRAGADPRPAVPRR